MAVCRPLPILAAVTAPTPWLELRMHSPAVPHACMAGPSRSLPAVARQVAPQPSLSPSPPLPAVVWPLSLPLPAAAAAAAGGAARSASIGSRGSVVRTALGHVAAPEARRRVKGRGVARRAIGREAGYFSGPPAVWLGARHVEPPGARAAVPDSPQQREPMEAAITIQGGSWSSLFARYLYSTALLGYCTGAV